MAFAYIREYSDVLQNPSGTVQIAAEPGLVDQRLAVGGSPVQSNPFNVATRFIRINTDVVLSFVLGTPGGLNNPVAALTNGRMAANQTEYFKVNAGDAISVVANT